MGIKWKDDEIEYLKKLYLNDGLTLSELYPIFNEKFNKRSLIGVQIKIKKLKLRHTKYQTKMAKSRLNAGNLNAMFGKIGPNKDKTKENCERIKLSADKLSITRKEMFKNGELPLMIGDKNPMFGKNAWNKGMTKYDDIRIFNSCEKLSLLAKNRWIELSEEQKNDRIGKLTKCATLARKDTKIEIIIEKILKEINIEYIKNHRNSKFVFDFYLPKLNYIIECQGDYWHANPIIYENKKLSNTQLFNVERDRKKIEYINLNKFNYIYLWENYILKNLKELKDIILFDISKNNNIIHI